MSLRLTTEVAAKVLVGFRTVSKVSNGMERKGNFSQAQRPDNKKCCTPGAEIASVCAPPVRCDPAKGKPLQTVWLDRLASVPMGFWWFW
jgi:hypothetical protein